MPQIAHPARPLAYVSLFPQRDGSQRVEVGLLPTPHPTLLGADARAVVALDASRSMRPMYGGCCDANYTELVARKTGELLCPITHSGRIRILYWSLGQGGAEIELVGDLDAEQCRGYPFRGPSKSKWGTGTKMLPIIKHIIEDAGKGASFTMGVIMTDGIIEDEKDCVDYCLELGRRLKAGMQPPVRLILLGLGEMVDEAQFDRFDNMFGDTSLGNEVDLWACGLAASMQDEDDIFNLLFGDLFSEDAVIAESGLVVDDNGSIVAAFPEGLPIRFSFILPEGCREFTVRSSRWEVTQDLSGVLDV